MTGFSLELAIELMVSALLATTIAYCVVLNRRLLRLKADEAVLRATIGELITATEIAERAILGLKSAAAACDATLGARLQRAEGVTAEIEQAIRRGETLAGRMGAAMDGNPAGPPAAAGAVDPVRAVQRAAAEASSRLRAYRDQHREVPA